MMKPSRPNLKALTPSTLEEADLPRFPAMTGWFEPVLLGKLLWRVVLSDAFGQYADRRLMEAALDPVTKEEHQQRAQPEGIAPDADGAVWFDYVSDLGDGFDATYAVAWLLAQPTLDVGGGLELPRGRVLVMGGDEVYPTAQRDDYTIRMQLPYGCALPDVQGEPKIPLFLLPGNHDWYDGLANFLAIFCRAKATPIGRWRTHQRRSYFAVRLTENWWLWGIDIALVRDMDQPQADYFVGIAEAMPEQANIILCSAEPGWYKAEAQGDAYRTLSYAAWIANNAGKDLKIPLVLSGDSHHYARYLGPGAQYITSGGGGAFLHGTLELADRIEADWLRDRQAELSLQCCYPSKGVSRKLLDGNRKFGQINPELPWALAALYVVLCSVLSFAWRWDVAIALYAVLFGGIYLYARYQEGASPKTTYLSAAHAGAHMAVIVAISGLVIWINERFLGVHNLHWLLWLVGISLIAFTAGRWLAGQIFGWTLLISCRHFNVAHNDAFSAMKLESHRHFLRFRILGEKLTIFPIKLETVPRRNAWRANPARVTDPSASVFVAEPPLAPDLIEKPIIIDATRAPTTAEVKKPVEVSPVHSAERTSNAPAPNSERV